MSRKQVLFTQPIATGPLVPVVTNPLAPVSLAAAFSTAPTTVNFQDNIAYQMDVTTTNSTGNFFLQGSLNGTTWADLLPCGTVAAANDVIVVNANQIPYTQVRLRYQPATAGTGTVSILLMARTIGA